MGSSKDGQGPLNFQVLVSLYISNVFHILFSLCNVTWTWSMQFALVSLVKKMAIDHPYHTILQVCASYLSSSNYFACFWSKICDCTLMIKENINQTLFCQTIYFISNLNRIFTYFTFQFWMHFIHLFLTLFIQCLIKKTKRKNIIHPMIQKIHYIFCLASGPGKWWPYQG